MRSVLEYYMAMNFDYLLVVKVLWTDRQSLQTHDSRPIHLSHVRFFRFKFLSPRAQFKIHRTVTRLVLIYVLEAWTMTTEERNALRIFERKILRKICG